AVAVRGSRIIKVGTDAEVLRLKGGSTKVIDLQGKLVLPGFNDAHTHFENATGWFFEARLVDVNDEAEFLKRLAEATRRIPKGMWITGGDWGAFAAYEAQRKGNRNFQSFQPSLQAVDRLTPDHPVFFRRHDGAYFINSKGLQLARIGKHTPNPPGGEYRKDPRTGELTGMFLGTAGERQEKALPPPSRARTLIAARSILAELNSYGITSIHDIARVEEISQTKIFHTHLERSHSDLSIFTDLRSRGELTVRVYPILTMRVWQDLVAKGFKPGGGDDLIRFGALKAFIDGFYMSEPYTNNPDFSGGFTFRVVDEQTMEDDIAGADAAGFDPAIHVIGDKAHFLLLNWYEAAIKRNPPRDRRFRLIHAWYPALREIERAGKIHALADITPFHLIRELDSVEKKLGPERSKTAHAWRTMLKHGIRVSIVSDWPGSFDKSDLSPINPLENIYLAMTRQDFNGNPKGGWHPEEALSVEEAIQAYTINPAFASHEEKIKGSITEGKLADLVVLSQDILKIEPRALLTTKVVYTIFGGKIIYGGAANARQ
ncbi:MAG: amidohydrolase, partial [Blastocatellia bacterium]